MKRQSKNDFISSKIAKLMTEGKSQDEAVAIAYSMYNEKFKGGGEYIPKYQYGATNWYTDPMISQMMMNANKSKTNKAYEDPSAVQRQQNWFENSYTSKPFEKTFPKTVTTPQQTTTAGGATTAPVSLQQRDITPMITPITPTVVPAEEIKINGVRVGTPQEQLQKNTINVAEQLKKQQDNTFKQNPQEKYQFFNPYGGFNIENAAYLFGQGLESGNGFDLATSGLKLATGLGRNIMAGKGFANRQNQVMQEYQNDQRRGMTGEYQYTSQNGGFMPPTYQDGGQQQPSPEQIVQAFAEATQQDPQTILAQLQGLSPEEQQAALGQMYQQLQGQNQEQSFQEGGEQGGQEEQILQMVAQALQQGAQPEEVVRMLVEQGVPEELAVQAIQQVMQQSQNQQPQQQFQEGGEFKDTLTGEYTVEDQTAKDEDIVAELEHGEWMMTPEGNITKALGETHENGGIELTEKQIPEGTKIISDHLKVEKSARELSKKYDLKINANDTYAKVVDKWTKKSGLEALVNEELQVIKMMEKQAKKLIETPEREATIALNIETLQGELKEIQDKKTPLEEQRKPIFEEVFNLQEASKPKKENTATMEAGGTFNGDIIAEYAKKHNIPLERAQELAGMFKKGGMYTPQYQGAGIHIPTEPFTPYNADNQSGQSQAQYWQEQAQNNAVTTVQGRAVKYSPAEKNLIKEHYKKFVLDKKSLEALNTAIDKDELVFNQGMLETIGTGTVLPIQLQHKDKPDGTFGGQDEARINGYIYKDTFKQKTGKDFDPNNREHTKAIYDIVIPGLKEKGITYHGAPFTNRNIDAYGQIIASEPGFTLSKEASKSGTIDLDAYRKQSPGKKQLIADEYQLTIQDLEDAAKNDTNKFLYLTAKSKGAGVNAPASSEAPYTSPFVAGTPPPQGASRGNMGMLLLPDQTPMLPESLQPSVKVTRRFDRVDAPNFSPDAMISEIRRQEQAAMQSLSSLPDAQRASAIAQVQANTASEISKVMGAVQTQNMQGKVQTDAMNAQVQMAEENARQQDVLSYEARTFKSDAITQANLRNYYNTMNKINVGNYNTIQSLNMLNAMTPNQAFTGDEVVTTNMDTMGNYSLIPTPTTTTKKKALKKKGGRFKK